MENTEINQNPGTAPAVPPTQVETPSAKTFTQEEVDRIVGSRLAKAMKGMPGEEELKRFRSWESTQQTNETTIATLTKERDTATGRVTALEAEIAALKQQNYVSAKGFSGEDAEFVIFKAAKMVDDKTTFEQAVDRIAEEHSKRPSFSWAAPVGGGDKKASVNETMNALIRGAVK